MTSSGSGRRSSWPLQVPHLEQNRAAVANMIGFQNASGLPAASEACFAEPTQNFGPRLANEGLSKYSRGK